jgi:quercetin dioxygenase-like cupin family protein
VSIPFTFIFLCVGFILGIHPQRVMTLTATNPVAADATAVLQRVEIPGTDRELGMGIANFSPNAAKPRQKAIGPETCYVLSGEVIVEMQGRLTKVYRTGESFQIPAMIAHRTTAGQHGAKVLATWVHTPGDHFNIPSPH